MLSQIQSSYNIYFSLNIHLYIFEVQNIFRLYIYKSFEFNSIDFESL